MDSTRLPHATLPPDTQAVLLLCGTFARRGGKEASPLTPTEYNALASWLNRQGKRPASLLQTPEESLSREEPGLPSMERLRALLDRGFQMAAAVDAWHSLGLWVISRAEDCYPERLWRHLRSAAPPLLYGAGDISRLNRGGLAIVGSRHVDEKGLSFTRQVAERCAAQDVQIISGGARGVDQASVTAALEAGGGAVAVLADRLDRIATSRDAKEPLRTGRLTLITPYKPESGFDTGKAMGRNKHIYALADYALVVHFKTGEGGTWAGAIERLRHNKPGSPCVPVFVRVHHNPEGGLKELQCKGALPFPEEDFWKDNLADLSSRAAALLSQPQAALEHDSTLTPSAMEESATSSAGSEMSVPPSEITSPPAAPAPETSTAAEADTCYHRCLPLLLQNLHQEIGEKQLAEMLDLVPGQLKKWLPRAVEEGKVIQRTKKGKKVYLAASAAAEQTLFDRDGDAA